MPLSAARVLLHPPKRYALSFDGENDYVEVADDLSLRLSESFTIEALVKTVDYADYRLVVTKWKSGNYWFGMWQDSGQLRAYVKSGGNTYYVAGSTISTNIWHHLSTTFGEGVLKLFVDGELDASRTDIPTPLDTGDDSLHVGHNNQVVIGSQHFHGTIALVRIYNRALSDSEIQHNCLNPMSPVLDGLVLWLKMEEGSGTTVHDYSGYGNDGTIYGATWKEITHPAVRTLTPVRVLSNVR